MDLTTSYLGLSLKNPIVAAPSPLSKNLAGILALEASGASAVVLPSLFEEEIEIESQRFDHFLDLGSESYAEALSYFPRPEQEVKSSEGYLETIRQAKSKTNIPIIASLNGATPGGWLRYAKMMEEAGADALELNLYYLPTDPFEAGHVVETRYMEVVRHCVSSVNIPLSVKIGPYFSSLPNFANQLVDGGARGVVLFNRFYQPDIDLDTLEAVSNLTLSSSNDLRLPLRWTALLSGGTALDFAITTGVHNGQDVIKSMMAGAKVTMVASELLEHGVGRLAGILGEVESWMSAHEYDSIVQMQGSMRQPNVSQPSVYERANYMRELGSLPA